MLILGIETATPQVGVAIGGHEGVLASAHSSRGKQHAETLVPMIEFVCSQARVELSEIGVIAVDVGPGLFTGLRVGVATAKAMAQALRIPMIGVASLDLTAFPLRFTSRLIVTAIDARRSELFVAHYRQSPGGIQQVSEPRVQTPEDLASELGEKNDDVLLVGDGALRYADLFGGVAGRVELVEHGMAFPSASALVQLAHARALREDFVQPSEVLPLYLRKPDADEIDWSARERT